MTLLATTALRTACQAVDGNFDSAGVAPKEAFAQAPTGVAAPAVMVPEENQQEEGAEL